MPSPRPDTDLLRNLSRELRHALTAMLGYAQLLERGLLSKERAESVEQILAAGWDAAHLLNEVDDITGAEAHDDELHLEAIEVRPFLEQLAALVGPRADQAQVELVVGGVDRRCPPILADRRRLALVLLGLMSSTVAHTDAGSSIELSCVRGPARAMISIADSKAGLTPERIAALFEPFERLGASVAVVGSGETGLALSTRTVELMRGSLHADATPGRGAAFTMSLPLAPDPEA